MPSHHLNHMPAHVLRNFLYDICQMKPAGDYRVPCASPNEASRLRSRFNKLRATDRSQAQRDYAAVGHTLDRTKGESPMDWLVFRVEGNDCIITKSPTTKADLYRLVGIDDLLTENDKAEDAADKALRPAIRDDIPGLREAQGIGAYDTAPKSDENPFS